MELEPAVAAKRKPSVSTEPKETKRSVKEK